MNEDAQPAAARALSNIHEGTNGIGNTDEGSTEKLTDDKIRFDKGQDKMQLKIDGDQAVAPSEENGQDKESTHIPKNGFFSPNDNYQTPTPINGEEGKHSPLPEKDRTKERSSTPQSPEVQSVKSSSVMSSVMSQNRDRSGSRPPESVNGAHRSSTLSSMVFVSTALEHIAASKEAKRKGGLHDSVQTGLTAIRSDASPSPEVIFEPLRLATETTNIQLTTTALDCISKLITYSYFSISAAPPENPAVLEQQQTPLIERAIDTICDCFQDEATPAEVQLQIVKSLLAAVLNDKIIVHGAGLLKAVRQIFNIFLLSKSSANQQVAQGTLTQMVGTVFERVKARLLLKEARLNMSKLSSERGTANGSQVDINGENSVLESSEIDISTEADGSSGAVSVIPSDQTAHKEPGEKLTLQSFENAKNFDDTRIGDNAPTMVTRAKVNSKSPRTASGQQSSANGYEEHNDHDHSDEDEEDEIYVKDAFLVFRSMCRLSVKGMPQDQIQDLKSPGMRSKLISLAIIRTLLNNNMAVFVSPLVTIRSSINNEPASFGQAINQYLRLTVSRNGASSIRQVFETSIEIFWLMLKDMRIMLKVCRVCSQIIPANCSITERD